MLPKLDVPLYEVKMPLSKKTYRFRPFLVKEEKLLLMAIESGDENATINTIKQVVNNCCVDEIDVDDLAVADLEFFFLNLRARSVGEIVELQYRCNNKVKDEEGNDQECGNVVPLEMNVLDVEVTENKEHTNKIELTDKLGVVMKYPSFSTVDTRGDSEVERLMATIVNCVDYIYDENTIYYAKDVEKQELTDFIENLSRDNFTKIQNFFETMPKIQKHVDFKCKKCGYHENIVVEGVQNFFG